MNNKNTLAIGVAALVIAGIVAFFVYQQQGANQDTVQAGTPSYAPAAPLENKPDLNPVNKTNPFQDVKTNPFE